MEKSMHLALFLEAKGCHYSGWRINQDLKTEAIDWKVYKNLAKNAEKAKLDMIFMADKLSIEDTYGGNYETAVTYRVTERPEPMTVLAALSAVTEHIGIGGTISSTFAEPFHVARTLATLDHISSGRAAWNVVTSTSDGESNNFTKREHLLSHAERYQKAEQFMEAVKLLWDTWEDDALIEDKQAGIYADKNKIHYANYESECFNVKGPLNVPRSPQGHPVTIQAGGSTPFMNLAAKHANIVFAAEQSSLESGQKFYQAMKEKVRAHHRDPEELKILPGFQPVVGRTEKEARERFEMLKELHNPMATLTHLSSTMNYDWSQHQLSDPFPDILDKIERRDRFSYMLNKARDENMTVEGFAKWIGSSGYMVYGTPDSIADHMARWYLEKAVDGFVVMPPYVPEASDDFFELVVPELQSRGVFRSEYTGSTLREHLGLRRPANRWSKHVSAL